MKKVINYINNHKADLIKASLWAVFMVAVFAVFYILKGRNEFYVSMKDKLLILGCVVLSTLLFLFRLRLPRWLSALGEVFVMFFTPVWLFNTMEPLINSMESFEPTARFYNIIIVFSVFAFIYAVTQHAGIAVGVGSLLVYVLYLVDYFTVAFRGTPFILSDILSARTAAGVMGNYNFVLSAGIMDAFYVLALLTAIGFFFNARKKKLPLRLSLAGVSLALSAGIIIYLLCGDVLTKKGFSIHDFVPISSAERNGFPLNTVCSLKESFLKAPEGYSAGKAEKIIKKYQSDSSADDVSFRPNIIVIMNESFTDFDYLETVETSEPTIPKFKALKDNCVKGTLISSIYGGNTPNSEFEFMTGCSLAFLPQGMVTFQQLIDNPLPTFNTQLKDLGYSASAIHLYNPEYFSRSRIYPLLGFDEFININNTSVNLEWFYDYVWDRCSFEAIEQVTEKSGENPCYAFCVTIQNHGGYWQGLSDIVVLNGSDRNYANDYSSLLKITDDAFADMLDYYSDVEEPTLIVMFGDHQPNLFDDFYDSIWAGCDYTDEEKHIMKQKVPFVIWANYDIEEKDMGTMSINYLGPTVLKTAGLPMSDYFKYLDNLRETLPVISGAGFIDKDGNYFTETDNEEYKELLCEYEYLQYYYLKGNSKNEFFR